MPATRRAGGDAGRGGKGRKRLITAKVKAKRTGGRSEKGRSAPKNQLKRRGRQAPAGGGAQARPGAKMFPQLGKGDGLGVYLVVAERAGDVYDQVVKGYEIGLGGGRGATAGGPKRFGTRAREALAAFGHSSRIQLLSKLLQGPATYQALQKITKLKPGPLYHHINQLRLARLILPKQRDLYELTRGGRNLILAAMAIGGIISDQRRRPLSGAK